MSVCVYVTTDTVKVQQINFPRKQYFCLCDVLGKEIVRVYIILYGIDLWDPFSSNVFLSWEHPFIWNCSEHDVHCTRWTGHVQLCFCTSCLLNFCNWYSLNSRNAYALYWVPGSILATIRLSIHGIHALSPCFIVFTFLPVY